jgi:arylsulfatase A-like enzyme
MRWASGIGTVFGAWAALAVPGSAPAQTPPNVLLVVLDDVGVDLVGSYGEVAPGQPIPPEHAATPSLDALAGEGVLFRNAWSSPLCSATRSSILTGRYPFRHGVGDAFPQLIVTELLLPEVLSDGTHFGGSSPYTHAAIGKWHVTAYQPLNGNPGLTPMEAGFGAFHGAAGNLDGESYFAWTKSDEVVEGAPTVTVGHDVYATTDNVDDAIGWIQAQGGPWFLWLAFNAVHTPIQGPPSALHTQSGVMEGAFASTSDPAEMRLYRRAMLEAMDAELGRLLDGDAGLGWNGIDLATTTVIVVGDNGTERPLPEAVNRGEKTEIWEGGINVPLVIAGEAVDPAAEGAESPALVHVVDLFATVLDVAGVDPGQVTGAAGPIDGRSLLPLLTDPGIGPGDCPSGEPDDDPTCTRATVYADGAFPIKSKKNARLHDATVRDADYKFIRRACTPSIPHTRELYDLVADPGETTDLVALGLTPAEQTALDALEARLEALTATDADDPCPGSGSNGRCGLGAELVLPLGAVVALRRIRHTKRA